MADRLHTEVSHLNQLRKSHIALDRHTDLVTIRKLLDDAEHFVFTAVPEADDEVVASARAMKKADVWHLPHPVCTFEFNARLTLEGVVKYPEERLIVLITEHETLGPIAPYFFVRGTNDRHRWIAITYRQGSDTRDDDEATVEVRVELGQKTAYEMGRKAGHAAGIDETVLVGDDDGITTGQSLQLAVSACLVALHTRGIRRERMVGDKVLLKGRKEPRDAYTRVLVAECMESGDASAVPGERHKVRLHIRRGHIRHQPHGPGRKYTRTIWIQQQLVGYVEEGRITHDHYEHYPAEAHP